MSTFPETIEAIEAAATFTTETWKDQVINLIQNMAREKEFFTPIDVQDAMKLTGIPRPKEGRAMGPVFVLASKKGLIEHYSFARDESRRSHHNGLVRVWRSKLYARGT